MPVIINGTTGLSGVSTVNLANGSVTQNILANGVAGTGPAFSACRTSDQTGITTNVWTKVALNVETFDTANCFDSTTNYRFTPNVAGYYQFNGKIFGGGSAVTSTYIAFYKNGALISQNGLAVGGAGVSIGYLPQIADVIYMNGTTDYIELYGYIGGTSPQFTGGTGQFCILSGALARAA